MRFKRGFTDPVPKQREQALREAGIDVFPGRAGFETPDSLRVGDNIFRARHVLLANGARPVTLGVPGEGHIIHSDRFLKLGTLPRRILFVGGGYISFEFAHLAVRAGADVRIVHRGPRALAGFDADPVDLLLKKTRALGIEIELTTELSQIEQTSDGLVVHAHREGNARRFTADLVVHGAGRVPNLDDMDLERGEVIREKRGVTVNEYLQSVSNPRVYAAGDAAATGGLPLTPVAAMESHVAAANLLKGNHATTDYRAVPTVVFTVPPLAAVGLDESAADNEGRQYETQYEKTGGWYLFAIRPPCVPPLQPPPGSIMARTPLTDPKHAATARIPRHGREGISYPYPIGGGTCTRGVGRDNLKTASPVAQSGLNSREQSGKHVRAER
jgi:glutathione reductase (NADPH)